MRPLTITIRQCCRLTGLGRTKLFELIRQNRLESIKVDGRRLVLMDSVEALVANSSVGEK